jgi:hypothetical protein
MNREILFKAKRLSDGAWVEGYLYRLHDSLNPFIMLRNRHGEAYEVDPSTVCQYINVDTREECCTGFESHKIFTGDMLGEWGEDEDGNECVCILGIVTYWESEGRYVLADEDGLCNDWTLEDMAQPENWPNLIHCGSIHDGEDGQ